ncbi:hypothetical protein GWI33_013553 [Rhynchophorus ferrugineus]|uniref:Uncharacterized protein n=1 Tax=Rhynchophorus ferrugineus TaxID=354439 RepID=A0A834MD47_RHYFE|nr:hypothetical protein GWI33_013553 [Rhynchophorus ferrugineus]
MSLDRKSLITMFQTCTGVKDILIAIRVLEGANWNLPQAICKIVSPELRKSYPKRVVIVKNKPRAPRPSCSTSNQPHASTSTTFTNDGLEPAEPRILTLNIKYGRKILQLKVPDTFSFNDVKRVLSEKVNVEVANQLLLLKSESGVYENIPFSSLVLPPEINMLLTIKQNSEETVD